MGMVWGRQAVSQLIGRNAHRKVKVLNFENDSQFDDQGRFIFRAFDQARPFSSFLPGIGGLYGIPMWVFYTNRGQAITSFGVESKDHPIMEFQPANKAYQLTAALGFRTFLRGDGWFAEPFSPWDKSHSQRDMFIGMNEVEIVETNLALGLETSVVYFNLLNEDFAALARKVTFRNIGATALNFDVLDGMPALMPYGVDNGLLKNIGRTIEAWMQVFNLEERIPFYRLRASAGDTSEVRTIEAGHFALGFKDGELLPVFVDPMVVFGTDTAFSHPQGLDEGLDYMKHAQQIAEGRTPCAIFGASLEIEPGESQTISSVYGFAADFYAVQDHHAKILSENYLRQKRAESRAFVQELTEPIATHSANRLFDAYARQTFLDNVMRGGWPEILAGKHAYHVYSRKHGDPERDYNHFYLSAENFSQGNSNYRDVNQNRRSDVFFEPRVKDFNIRLFMSLIQTDGYNPLVVKGTKFTFDRAAESGVLGLVEQPERLSTLFEGEFSPGELLDSAAQCGLKVSAQEFLDRVMGSARQHIQADFGEGFWVDHWTYNLDLIDSYLAIYPDKKSDLLFDSAPLPFFESPAVVNPRDKKYVLDDGRPRQFHAIREDEEKQALLEARKEHPNWVRTDNGQGEVFRVSLFAKLVMLTALKFSTRDPLGMGVEMEAGRPGWYDALNGLPGLFGSSMPETFELLRLINFISTALQEDAHDTVLPLEVVGLLNQVLDELRNYESDFVYWDRVSSAREAYRRDTRLGVSGHTVSLSSDVLLAAFVKMKDGLMAGIERAVKQSDGIPPTYFYYDLVEYETLEEKDEKGRAYVLPKQFDQKRLPLFLEGPVRYLKILRDHDEAQALYDKVKHSPLYDGKLGMYKLNASLLSESHEIGRARAFSPGWLENESIWLHMSYKYLLEILNARLYEQFFGDIPTSMPPFLDPAVYGRSPLENSSFLVSSAHPDASMHGAGFVARLSGSTAEFLSIWQQLMTGGKPFAVEDGELILHLHPLLPGQFFTQEGSLSFNFLGRCRVIYHNPARKDTFAPQVKIQKYMLHLLKGETITIEGELVPAPYAEMVRDGKIPVIEIKLH